MKDKLDNKELIRLFNEGNSCTSLSNMFNCDPETIRLRLRKEGIDTSKKKCEIKCVHCNGESRMEGKTKYGKQRYLCLVCGKLFVEDINKQKNEMLARHEIIKKMYLIDKMSTIEIAKILGVSSTVPQRILKKYGVTRNVIDSLILKHEKLSGIPYIDYLKKLPAYVKYKKRVNTISKRQPLKMLANYNKRGRCGIEGAYQLDHKYSILEGFKNDISPEIIGNIKNLEFIPWEENLKKSDNCSITLEELTNDIIVRVK